MAHIPVTRAPALPTGHEQSDDLVATPYRLVTEHARTGGDVVAYVVGQERHERAITWAEVAHAVERAAAGLVRSGLRADQVVVSLLPAAHPHPELDLALRVIGAVVVHVSPDATADDIRAQLHGADVRLVVAESEHDLGVLQGLQFSSAELFTIDGGRGWERLLSLGAERLRMDPDAVTRVDRVVDPAGAVPRLLDHAAGLTSVAAAEEAVPALPAGEVGVAVGHQSDPVVQHLLEAHLASGGTLCLLPQGGTPLADALRTLSPSVLGLSAGTRGALTAEVRVLVDEHRTDLIGADAVSVVAATLPVPPPVVLGDPALLPRRSRRAPGRDFKFDTERAPEPDASAFRLPSLPLFGGESVLDQLLLARAREGRE